MYPSDWVNYTFDELFAFEGGLSISRANLSNEGICYLHYGDIHKTNDNYINIEKNFDSIPKYNKPLESINKKYLLNDGDIVFADASEDYEGIGKAVVVKNPSNIPFISGLHTIVARDKTDVLNNEYKRFFLSDWNIRKQIMLMATGISVYGLSQENVRKIKVTLPKRQEQQKIASILSTWDKAIELKEKLIEQKKQQKKGLMQKLLTGEVRLPGFEGKWRSLRILNFCNTYSGGTPSRTRKEFYENGTIPWIKSGELNSRKVTQTEEYITEKALANSTAKLVNPETILLALYGATAGVVAMSKIRASINQAILAIVPNDNCDNNFLFYYLENHMDKVTKKYTQGGQPNLNADIVKKMVVKLPSIEEQKAIANILSNIDNNIELLEKELNWLKQQKKGLMQLLLTGKVRVKV